MYFRVHGMTPRQAYDKMTVSIPARDATSAGQKKLMIDWPDFEGLSSFIYIYIFILSSTKFIFAVIAEKKSALYRQFKHGTVPVPDSRFLYQTS